MRHVPALWVCLLLAVPAFPQQGDEGQGRNHPCLSDPAGRTLRAAHPLGVPGRTIGRDDMKASEADAAFTYIIPVVVHVMHSHGPEQNVTEAQIHSMIDVMNEGFGRYGEGANQSPLGGDARIKFCLASIDPDGNPTPGYDYTATAYAGSLDPITQDTLMKNLNRWDPLRYLNVWTVRRIMHETMEYDGYSYNPEQVAGSAYDGIVLKYTALGRDAGTATQRGKTITHEAGHYFGLRHPWGNQEAGSCPAASDDCEDTPPVPDIAYVSFPACLSANLIPPACDGGRRQVENYMDYSAEECQNLFTTCQRDRMRRALLRYRSYMVSEENLRLTGCSREISSIPAQGVIAVYPNPGNRYVMVNVDIEDPGTVGLEMYDFAGRRVFAKVDASLGRGPISLDVSQMAQGTYSLRVFTSRTTYEKKIFVGVLGK
ncbi:MAG: hypothetical protein RLZZ165_2424 [Bacteroidota bacterium]